jgi:shikimate kinase
VSLFLIGARGAGKTTAGRRAAARVGAVFVDSDEEIEREARASVAEILEREGEEAFRALERRVLLALLPRPAQIVATGGGSVLDVEVRGEMRRCGQVLWLRAPTALLQRRICGSIRPALTGSDAVDELPLLVARREPLYRECADLEIETGDRSPDEVADVIEQLWETLPHHDLR